MKEASGGFTNAIVFGGTWAGSQSPALQSPHDTRTSKSSLNSASSSLNSASSSKAETLRKAGICWFEKEPIRLRSRRPEAWSRPVLAGSMGHRGHPPMRGRPRSSHWPTPKGCEGQTRQWILKPSSTLNKRVLLIITITQTIAYVGLKSMWEKMTFPGNAIHPNSSLNIDMVTYPCTSELTTLNPLSSY